MYRHSFDHSWFSSFCLSWNSYAIFLGWNTVFWRRDEYFCKDAQEIQELKKSYTVHRK